MCSNQTNPKPDEPVVLGGLPDGFLDDLPLEDREAISAKIAKLVRLNEYDESGRAELEFLDSGGTSTSFKWTRSFSNLQRTRNLSPTAEE